MQLPSVPLTDYIFHKSNLSNIPFSGTFELSPVCNFNCKMCYVRKSTQEVNDSVRKILSLQDWIRIADEAYEKGLLYILLTGGEPLLWPDFWELYEYLVDKGFFVSINTNGSLINEKVVERLKKRPPRRVNITLYGAGDDSYYRLCDVKNIFSRVDESICRLKNAGIQTKINCSLTPYNACDLEAIVDYSKEKEIPLQIADYMFPPIRRDESMVGQNERFTPKEVAYYRLKAYLLQFGEEKYRDFLMKIIEGEVDPMGLEEGCIDPLDGRIRCRAGKSSFWITWDGYMTPCGMMTEPKVDVKQADFNRCWTELVQICKDIRISGICDKCPHHRFCYSCAAMALSETGSFQKVPVYLCEIIKEIKRMANQELYKK